MSKRLLWVVERRWKDGWEPLPHEVYPLRIYARNAAFGVRGRYGLNSEVRVMTYVPRVPRERKR